MHRAALLILVATIAVVGCNREPAPTPNPGGVNISGPGGMNIKVNPDGSTSVVGPGVNIQGGPNGANVNVPGVNIQVPNIDIQVPNVQVPKIDIQVPKN